MPSRIALCTLIGLSLCSVGCGKKEAPKSPPAVDVGIFTVAPSNVDLTTELPGRTAAYRIAEVRPQVSGIIRKRLFTEGSRVEAGQQLLQIDPAPYEAAVGTAQAVLAHAQAQLTSANLLEKRYQSLSGKGVISQQDYDNATAARAQAAADVESAQAQLKTARINLTYTRVLAPIAGRIGRALATEGALVTSGQADTLATIQQLDPIYVDVTQSSTDLLRLKRQLAQGELMHDAKNGAEVALTLEDGTTYQDKGRLEFSEVAVNASTGSVLLRAVFPNPRGELLPGMFVRAKLAQGVKHNALLVPQRAVTRNRKGEATVMWVGPDDKVSEKIIVADRTVGDQWLVTQGLTAGDRVVIEGLQKIHDGSSVHPVAASEAPSVAQR